MRALRVMFFVAMSLAAALPSAPAVAGTAYYVDPVEGSDAPEHGTETDPWRTASYAIARIASLPPAAQAGAVLNLRANALHPPVYFPPTLRGTAAEPIVVQPYDGPFAIFDGGEPELFQPGAWEPVPGHPDEWRSTQVFSTPNGERIAWGQMMDRGVRLITYMDIEDLRATNESYRGELGNRVAVSDPRPAPGPVVGDPTHKIPYAYLGPGIYFAFEDASHSSGRIHLRLSPTHIGAPGIADYPGDADPNTLALSIAREGTQTGRIAAQNLVLRNLVFQNGGRTTLTILGAARNVTFDHCQVHGAQFGVRMEPAASGLKFHHCTFDGGLAPWTSRSDVKNEYYFDGPSDCRKDPKNGLCINEGGAKTHDILVIHQASDSEYVSCTFRRGHDGLQVSGTNVEVRDSLFEDLNDEVLQFGNDGANVVSYVRIHGNVIRQALSAVSFVLNPKVGPLYFYRNVIDQRVPTRGYRILPPDAPAPWIWRYGNDFKDDPSLPFYSYQNTFIGSHLDDKSSYASHLFYGDPAVAPTHMNNIHLFLNLDWPLSRVPATPGPVVDGNVWYRYHLDPEPLFRKPLFVGPLAGQSFFTFEQLWAVYPGWETSSQLADPELANFGDESFDHASWYPNTDFRPVQNGPAHGSGVALPVGLPDDFPPSSAPDVGARPVDAPILVVGVDGEAVFPERGVPVALAGLDQELLDKDGDGFERVTLDASESHDPDGSIVSYEWRLGTRTLATGSLSMAMVDLPEGDHQIRLLVTDDAGVADSDSARIRVVPAAPGENHLACPGFEERPCAWQLPPKAFLTTAPSEVHSGSVALRLTQTGLSQRFSQRVPVSAGLYTVSGWLATRSVAGPQATLLVNLLAGDGTVLDTESIAKQSGTSPYGYHEILLDVPETVAFVELVGMLQGAGGGRALFDDLRVRDGNLLRNGRFEVRAPSGHLRQSPGWEFGRGGAIVDAAEDVRSGRYALELAPYNGYHLIRQTIVHVPGRSYLVSGWVKTSDLVTAPTFDVRFLSATGANLGPRRIAEVTSEGAYTYVSREIRGGSIPAATALLRVELTLAQVPQGTAWFEDLRIEPIDEQ